ncbi:MAG: biopolymer transporter ExbD [Acidobacteria bacterium]|nr:biopolymer transporter ExbD [Acidobacteriota bacterium]
MAFTNSSARGAELNVTPLIDILLVLLIIFMVITPARTLGLSAALPQATTDPPAGDTPDRAIVIQLAGDSDLRINTEPIRLPDLGPRLLDIFKTRAERVVFVQAGADTEFQYVAQVVDIAKGASIDHVGLLTARLNPAH